MPRRNNRHPGVWFDPRKGKDGRYTYWARGPVIERLHGRSIVKVPVRTRPLAEQWATQQSKLDELRRAGMAPAVTFGEFLVDYAQDLEQAEYAGNTRVGYLWAAREAARLLGEHTPTHVTTRAQLYELKRSVTGNTTGTKRTKWRRMGRLFHALREQGLVPHLSSDTIEDCFTPRRGPVVERSRPRCLDPGEISAMLEASSHPLPRFLLLVGMRIRAALGLTWEMVDLDSRQLDLPAWLTKTKRARVVNLRWRPTVEDWLHDQERDHELVFGGITYDQARRLLTYHSSGHGQQPGPLRRAVPGLKWKDLRSTCSSYLHSLPISATHLERARDMGHSLATAERDYVDVVRGLPAGTDTLEAAMRLSGDEGDQHGRIVRLA